MATTDMEDSPMPASIVHDRRRLLTELALLLGAGEFADAFTISFWEGAAVVSALFLAGAAWNRRRGIGAPILIGALCVFELQSFPTWARTGIEDWTTQIAFVVVSAFTLAVALTVLKRALAARKTAGLKGASA
jgi:hypothetical protein